MTRSILSTLTKKALLNKIGQITIFSTYFNIPVEVIQHCIDSGELICSPLRIDECPTCGFRYDNRGKLKFKDFAGYFWGDCFDAVAHVLSIIQNRDINVSDKHDFIIILRHIALTFKDIFYGDEVDNTIIEDIHKSIEVIKNKKPIIDLVIRQWNADDKDYWGKIGVDLHTLNTNFIYPIDQYYINIKTNPQPKYYYNIKDPCYAYLLGKDKNKINNIKLYFPKRDKSFTRFITNCNHLEGIYNLNKDNYDIIVITKSTKDRVAINCHITKMKTIFKEIAKLNIGFINIPHETYRLRQIEYNWMLSKISNRNGYLLSLMDNDETGINQAIWLKNEYNIFPVLIPGKFKSKDFAELKQEVNFNKISNLILKTIDYVRTRKSSSNTRNIKADDAMPF